jgi:hypothetical protein
MYAEKSLRTEKLLLCPLMTRDLLCVMKILAEGGLDFLTVAGICFSTSGPVDAFSILVE